MTEFNYSIMSLSESENSILLELEELVRTFTEDECKHLDFSYEEVSSLRSRMNTKVGKELGIQHAKRVLDSLKEDIGIYREKQRRIKEGLVVSKLLERYRKLPDLWQTYVFSRTELGEADENEKDMNRNEKMFYYFGKISVIDEESTDANLIEQAHEMIDNFAKTLTQVEKQLESLPI